ncbi:HEPN domain-containing protein [Candidatus Woesearchaeota archaeon]|nr:HEPN domain-containing protein [Candidatus Woesearchaeota archaeon]
MENKKLTWCFKLKDGLKIVEPNERLSKSYLEQAKSSLLRAEKDLNDKDFLWATVAMYYAEYYALYSFLQKIGIKCENHACSILITTLLLGIDKTKTINEHKGKRIDAQYYMKVDQEIKIRSMLQEAKIFVSNFDEIISRLNENEIKDYRGTIFKNK